MTTIKTYPITCGLLAAIILSALAILAGCSKESSDNASGNLEQLGKRESRSQSLVEGTVEPPRPVEAEPLQGQIYRSLTGTVTLTLISRDELELRQGGTTLLCKYTKQDDALRVILTALGTTQVLYYRFVDEGLRGNDGIVLYTPAKLEATKQADLAEQRRTQEEKLAAEKREQDERRQSLEYLQAELVKRHARWSNFFTPGSYFTFKVLRSSGVSTNVLLLREGMATVLASDSAVSWVGKLTGKDDGKPFKGSYQVRLLSPPDNSHHYGTLIFNDLESVAKATYVRAKDIEISEFYSLLLDKGSYGFDLDKSTSDLEPFNEDGKELRMVKRFTREHIEHVLLTKLTAEEKRLVEDRATEVERARLAALAEVPKLLVGNWRIENRNVTYRADGTFTESSGSRSVAKGTWSIDRDILTSIVVERNGKVLRRAETIERRILEIDASKVVRQSLKDKTVSHLTRLN